METAAPVEMALLDLRTVLTQVSIAPSFLLIYVHLLHPNKNQTWVVPAVQKTMISLSETSRDPFIDNGGQTP